MRQSLDTRIRYGHVGSGYSVWSMWETCLQYLCYYGRDEVVSGLRHARLMLPKLLSFFSAEFRVSWASTTRLYHELNDGQEREISFNYHPLFLYYYPTRPLFAQSFLPRQNLFSTLLAFLHVSKSSIALSATVLGNHGSKKRISTYALQSFLITLKSVCRCVELWPVDL